MAFAKALMMTTPCALTAMHESRWYRSSWWPNIQIKRLEITDKALEAATYVSTKLLVHVTPWAEHIAFLVGRTCAPTTFANVTARVYIRLLYSRCDSDSQAVAAYIMLKAATSSKGCLAVSRTSAGKCSRSPSYLTFKRHAHVEQAVSTPVLNTDSIA